VSRPEGSCFGFEVRSSIDLRFLRDPGGAGGAALTVSAHDDGDLQAEGEPLVEWLPHEQGTLHARLYERGDAYRLWIDGVGWYLVDPEGPCVAVPESEEPVRREERLWGLPALLCFLRRGDLPLHASAVQVGDGALVIGAPSRSGKTTLAAAFWREGFRVLSEDLVCIAPSGPSVLPGPALLRLRPDMAEHLGIYGEPAAIVGPDRVRLPLAGTGAGDSRPVPLRGVVVIGDASERVSMARLTAVEAIPALWQLSFALPEIEAAARCFRDLTDLASAVPVWELRRPVSVEALPRVLHEVASRA
jgi:hypothetical protein